MNLTYASLVLGCTVFAASIGVLGCLKGTGHSGGPQQQFSKIGDLQPFVEPYPRAYILTGSPVETEVKTTKSQGHVRLDFMLHGSALDEEIYTYDEASFCYSGNRLEEFDPGIPLLKFPLTVGDKWTWKGEYRTGGTVRKASAEVKCGAETLATVGGEFSTVRADVTLSMESGGAKTLATRALTFWFAPKRGVVRRKFQDGTTREPMPPRDYEEKP